MRSRKDRNTPRTGMRLGLFTAIVALLVTTAGLPAAAAEVGDDNGKWDGFWGPWKWGSQPQLSERVPAPKALGQYDNADFDHDGVPNIKDNCLLVPNADQRPAVRPANGKAVGPDDMLQLSKKWKAENPDSRFRGDDQLGEACSGYNNNYLKTTKGLIEAPDPVKDQIFEYLGQSGPMFGGSKDPKPGTDAMPEGDGNMTPSLPMCSGWKKESEIADWIASGFTDKTKGFFHGLADIASKPPFDKLTDCGTGALPKPVEDTAFKYWFWAGKRLYTDENGGKISNRFVPGITEAPGFEQFISNSIIGKTLNRFWPPIFSKGTPQDGMGYIYRGKSYVDGNDSILMDWRGKNQWPVGSFFTDRSGWLIYDECRAIQTGVYHCSAVLDLVADAKSGKRITWNEGWMPWVVKGPPSKDQYINAIRSPMDANLN